MRCCTKQIVENVYQIKCTGLALHYVALWFALTKVWWESIVQGWHCITLHSGLHWQKFGGKVGGKGAVSGTTQSSETNVIIIMGITDIFIMVDGRH